MATDLAELGRRDLLVTRDSLPPTMSLPGVILDTFRDEARPGHLPLSPYWNSLPLSQQTAILSLMQDTSLRLLQIPLPLHMLQHLSDPAISMQVFTEAGSLHHSLRGASTKPWGVVHDNQMYTSFEFLVQFPDEYRSLYGDAELA
ncbi:hypothetical protein B0H14DRAFT_2556762 [Mycena olivaceomarginata]|nr:hypothetical protein B0H14DRAFT_2556762 [Mycena olivaceomarginata]